MNNTKTSSSDSQISNNDDKPLNTLKDVFYNTINSFKNNNKKLQSTLNISKVINDLPNEINNVSKDIDNVKDKALQSVSDVAVEVAGTVGTVEEQAVVVTAIKALGKISEQIDQILKDPTLQNLYKKMVVANDYITKNKDNIKGTIKMYLDIFFSPMILSNQIIFNHVMLFFKKIILLYQKLPETNIQYSKEILEIMDKILKTNTVTDNEKNELNTLITNEIISIFNQIKKNNETEIISTEPTAQLKTEDKVEPSKIKPKMGGGGSRKNKKSKKLKNFIRMSLQQYKTINSKNKTKRRKNKIWK